MKKHYAMRNIKKLLIIAFLLFGTIPTINSQSVNPKGLYKLTEIIHANGKHLETGYNQYKYCTEDLTITLTYSDDFFMYPTVSFNLESLDGQPLKFTGELSKTKNKGIQVISRSDTTFTLRWFNDREGLDERIFPYKTNIDEEYALVKDSTDAILQSLNLFKMGLGTKSHRLQGSWKLRGKQQSNIATSQYWVEPRENDIYQVFGEHKALKVLTNANSPAENIQCEIVPCAYLSENAYDCGGQVTILNWFDNETVSFTTLDEEGRPSVTIWDRCSLPSNIQNVFGTNIPQTKKDITRFLTDGFTKLYGNKADSIRLAFETFDFAVNANESNNAIFPILMRCGFKDEYKTLKDSLLAELLCGRMPADEAVGKYVYWFYKNFDRHTILYNSNYFHQLQPQGFVNYMEVIPVYNPEPVGCKVDKETYLLRLPSCMGDLPTWDWLIKKKEEFIKSKCKYLILDLRGNVGGSDEFSLLFTELMCNGSSIKDSKTLYLNSTTNNKMLKKMHEQNPYTYVERVLAETDTAEEGSLLEWVANSKESKNYTPMVEKGAIIIDNFCASAGESPIRMIREYSNNHVKVYGRERTMGCDKTGNCNVISLPHSNMSLCYPMVVDTEFEKTCKKKQPGHEPDVIIPLPYPKQLTDNIDPWIIWISKKMKE